MSTHSSSSRLSESDKDNDNDSVSSQSSQESSQSSEEELPEVSKRPEPPSQRSLRAAARAQGNSHDTFLKLLKSTNETFLDADVREASNVQVALDHALVGCEQYIYALTLRLQLAKDDSEEDKKHNAFCLKRCKAVKESIPKAYADRIEKLTARNDRASSVNLGSSRNLLSPVPSVHSRRSKPSAH